VTSFETASALTRTGDATWTATLPPDWAQGRTTYGGLQAALATSAAAELAGADRRVRTLDVGFAAPLVAGPVEIAAEVLGSGRSATQVQVSLLQDGVLGCRAYVVAGVDRASSIAVPGAAPGSPAATPDASEDPGTELPYLEGVMPVFTQHVVQRWCGDAFPFTGAGPEGARIDGWCRHRTPASGLAAVVGILDAWPPTVLPMAPGPAPASTVRWSAHFVEPVPPGAEKGWFRYEGRTVHAADGYATSYARLYSGGRLVVWSEQLNVVYDRRSAAG
jgi:acyl-CoA thioesterase